MTDGRFSTSAPTGGGDGGDPYGFFATPVAAPATQFGSPAGTAHGPAGSPPVAAPFGGPGPSFGVPVQSPPGHRPRKTSSGRSGLVVVLVLLLAIGGGAYWWTHRGDGLPGRLGPYSRASAADQRNAAAGFEAGTTSVGGMPIKDAKVAVYGTATAGALVAEATIVADVPAGSWDKLMTLPGARKIGGAVCLTQTIDGKTGTVCIRVEGQTLVLVVGLGPSDVTMVAGWTDQVAGLLSPGGSV